MDKPGQSRMFLAAFLDMASLWKHPESKYYVACFTDRNGRRCKRSTKETNKAKAQKIADGLEQVARQKQTVRQVRAVISDLHKFITGQEVASLTMREHSDNWLAEKKGTSAATMTFYKGSVKKFLTFLGERADVPDLLAAADLVVLPSLFEGLPLVVLEAMALALPVVATRIGGTIEALGQDHPFLAPPGDPSLMADAIVAALADQIGSRTVGIQARRRFEERFTAARMGREMATLYRATMERVCVS